MKGRAPQIRLLILCVLSACLIAFGPFGKAEDQPLKDPLKEAIVPFKLLKTGHMTVEAKINDKGPYTLIFDTGAPINLLNNKVAKEAELLKGKAPIFFAPYGSKGDVKIKKLEVGQGIAADVQAAVMDHPTVSLISKHLGPIEGIVGFPFFARYKMTVDYRDQTLTLEPGTFQPPDVMKEMVKGLFGAEGNSKDGFKVVPSGALLGLVPGENGNDGSGLLVDAVKEGSPAAKAGVVVGDRLISLNDRWTDSTTDLILASSYLKPGSPVPLEISRAGKKMKLRVTPAGGF
jgi:membrane-associated protease RseP (regulator of RpoE activity)